MGQVLLVRSAHTLIWDFLGVCVWALSLSRYVRLALHFKCCSYVTGKKRTRTGVLLLLERFLKRVRTLCVALRIAPNSPIQSNTVINYVIAICLFRTVLCNHMLSYLISNVLIHVSDIDPDDFGRHEMHLLPEPLFSIPSDNTYMLSVVGTENGRIFMAGKDGCLYELTYQVGVVIRAGISPMTRSL